MDMKNQTRIFTVEGNIGSGKSTFVRNLRNWYMKTHPGFEIVFLEEPVKKWKSIKDKHNMSILEKFYTNQSKYAFAFQMMAYISRLAALKQAVEQNPNAVIITERSLYTDKEVFAKMLYEDGKIEEVEYQIYLEWFNEFQKEYPLEGIIYLVTDYKTCHERIEKRSREGESNISMFYLNLCANYHNKWICDDCFEKRVLEIDVTQNITPDVVEIWFCKFHEFITNMKNASHSKYHYSNCI